MNVADTERISRFLFFRRWYARATGRVKPEAFDPHPYIELSVSCTETLDENLVWQIGRNTAESRKDKPTLHGRADLHAHAVRAQALDILRDDNPLYHANIIGWDGEKGAQLSKAQELAAASQLFLVKA